MNKIIGALWQKEKDGMPYYSGVIQDFRGDINIAVFPNNRKEASNQPDMNIVISYGDRVQKHVEEPEPKKNGKKKKADEITPF